MSSVNRSNKGNDSDNSSSYCDKRRMSRNRVENGKCGNRLPNTLTYSLTLSHFPSLTVSPQRTPKSINIIDLLTTVFI